jgi:hypothetical protein
MFLPEDLVFSTRYYLGFYFSMVVPGTKCSQKNLKIFLAKKRGFSTGINTQKNFFLNFFLEFLGDFVPWY